MLTEELFKQWAILDVEFIRTSSTHRCIRKLCIKTRLNEVMEAEFYPCRRYKEIEEKYKQSFRYCQKYIHKLSYNPYKYSPTCTKALLLLRKFIIDNDVEIIFYKGGTIERQMCHALDITSLNIEAFGVKKAQSHVPREEVDCYFNQLNKMMYVNL